MGGTGDPGSLSQADLEAPHPKQVLESKRREAKQQSCHLGLSRHMAGNSQAGKFSCEDPLAREEGFVPGWEPSGQTGEAASQETPALALKKRNCG